MRAKDSKNSRACKLKMFRDSSRGHSTIKPLPRDAEKTSAVSTAYCAPMQLQGQDPSEYSFRTGSTVYILKRLLAYKQQSVTCSTTHA